MKKFLLSLLLLSLAAAPARASDKAPNETYRRVTETRTLRCAYTIYPPFFMLDPNTGVKSGASYEIFEELGRQLGLKVEWTTEVTPDTIFEGFKSNRYDAVCLGYASVPSRTWGGDFSKPFAFIPNYAYVRADEKKLKANEDMNKPSVKILVQDGEMSQIVRKEDFPAAQEISMPGNTQPSERLNMVATGKADATIVEPDIAFGYMQHNPGKIKRLESKPLRMQGCTVLIPHDEFQLKRMIDVAIDVMLWDGKVEKIVKKHASSPDSILLPALAYQPAKEVKK